MRPASFALAYCCCLIATARADNPTLVIDEARVIVGDGTVHSRASVVIQGDRIQQVVLINGKFDGAETISARNMTVMPGLIDSHVHIFGGSFTGSRDKGEKAFRDELAEEVPDRLKAYLRYGVTTVKSTGDPLSLILELREMLKNGKVTGPRLLVVGPGFTARDGHPASTLLKDDPWWRMQHSVEVDDPDDARVQVRRVAEKGVDAIKLVYHGGPHPEFIPDGTKMEKLRRDVMRAIIEESHRLELRATVHTWHEEDAIEVLQASADGLEHGVGNAPLVDDRLAKLLRSQKASYVPTLRVMRLATTPRTLPIAMQNLKRLSENHAPIVVGTDTIADLEGTPPGLNTVMEMELMVQAGMSAKRVVSAATRDAAQHLGLLDELGTVEPGKLADLIVVDGDPLNDISAIRKIQLVVQSGRIVYKAEPNGTRADGRTKP